MRISYIDKLVLEQFTNEKNDGISDENYMKNVAAKYQ